MKKIDQNHDVVIYEKAQMSKHLKNYVLPDMNYFVKMSVGKLVSILLNVVYALSQK